MEVPITIFSQVYTYVQAIKVEGENSKEEVGAIDSHADAPKSLEVELCIPISKVIKL